MVEKLVWENFGGREKEIKQREVGRRRSEIMPCAMHLTFGGRERPPHMLRCQPSPRVQFLLCSWRYTVPWKHLHPQNCEKNPVLRGNYLQMCSKSIGIFLHRKTMPRGASQENVQTRGKKQSSKPWRKGKG